MPGTVIAFEAGRRGGKSALMWHRLAAESKAAGRPIRCTRCERPHVEPPKFGRCACGNFAFGVKAAVDPQLQLEFTFAPAPLMGVLL